MEMAWVKEVTWACSLLWWKVSMTTCYPGPFSRRSRWPYWTRKRASATCLTRSGRIQQAPASRSPQLTWTSHLDALCLCPMLSWKHQNMWKMTQSWLNFTLTFKTSIIPSEGGHAHLNVHQNNKKLVMLLHSRTFTVYICMPLKNHTNFLKFLKYVENCYIFFNSVLYDILRVQSSSKLLFISIIIIIIIICVNDFKVKGDQTCTCFGLEREILYGHISIRRMFTYEIALSQLWSSIRCFCFSFQLQVIILLVPNMYRFMHHSRQPYVYHSHNIIFFQHYYRLFEMVYLFEEKAIMVSSLNEISLLYVLVYWKCDSQINVKKINKCKIILRNSVNKTYC